MASNIRTDLQYTTRVRCIQQLKEQGFTEGQVNAIMNAIISMILANNGIDPNTPVALSAAAE